jgi:hypothetical protein
MQNLLLSMRSRSDITSKRSPLSICRIQGDGACQFRAIAYWLQKFGLLLPSNEKNHLLLRRQVVSYILKPENWKRFKESVKFADGYRTKKDFEREMKKPWTYGGEATLVALAEIYNVNFVVLQDDGTMITNIEEGKSRRPNGTMILRRVPETLGEPHYDVIEIIHKQGQGGQGGHLPKSKSKSKSKPLSRVTRVTRSTTRNRKGK